MAYRLALVDERFDMPMPPATEIGDYEAGNVAAYLIKAYDRYLERRSYGSAWRSMGALGNLVRVDSKVARLKSLLWFNTPEGVIVEGEEETGLSNLYTAKVQDSLEDLPILAAFMAINLDQGNLAGKES